jgi:hypothetical protein
MARRLFRWLHSFGLLHLILFLHITYTTLTTFRNQ